MATDDDRGQDYKLERYKYILQQISFLNENTFRKLTFYKALLTAILGAMVALFVGRGELGIDAETAKVGLQGLVWLLGLVTLFILLSIGAGVLSWFDYRHDEADLLDEEVHQGYRKRPQWKNCWRWYEFHFAIIAVIVFVAVWFFVARQVLPML